MQILRRLEPFLPQICKQVDRHYFQYILYYLDPRIPFYEIFVFCFLL
nr:hypothetical protein Iba_chr06dCG4150 [Ipomoea batatas]GMD11432.1 hypothetical protein Iba_chr06fCG3670 [Ipomoea batatas]